MRLTHLPPKALTKFNRYATDTDINFLDQLESMQEKMEFITHILTPFSSPEWCLSAEHKGK